jgi:hypothetical protein
MTNSTSSNKQQKEQGMRSGVALGIAFLSIVTCALVLFASQRMNTPTQKPAPEVAQVTPKPAAALPSNNVVETVVSVRPQLASGPRPAAENKH